MRKERATAYKSPSQRARVLSEGWAGDNLYCPCCPSNGLECCANNREAIDFVCPSCDSAFQLKSSRNSFGRRILDGAFSAMARAIQSGATPNLIMLRYDSLSWMARDLVFVPNFAFTLSSIEKRPALTATARRAGWIGCNILICNVPIDLRIPMISAGEVLPAQDVRRRYQSIKSLQTIRPEQRGWTLDVLNIVRRIGRTEFNLADVYEYCAELETLHPNNRHIRDKIRQQLHRLRDLGFLEFSNVGVYRMLR